ncbi:hypothetical protein Asp14428_02250 [Actinoplanes sp. NBRC 14428]|uniref:Uncharacterized protein n=1 Tax=Pseudosporangium ferrugineum TaxID=439699 RepID=A0A2T0SIK7_9ACTN|nr:hypothetical protein [Pseudosporangium ferrugineum]PRY33254.1 hypothetical protein CLV70_101416 [Pseudosporangium ferrugineum]BCJ48750.1 hypothetical protein Asp14428_02250 [Actinoplanes sp. NBRC 14428]
MPISVNLDALLDKAYESTSLADLADAPVSALSGVSEADGEALQKAFNIKTIGDLAGNKYIRAAQAIAELGRLAK